MKEAEPSTDQLESLFQNERYEEILQLLNYENKEGLLPFKDSQQRFDLLSYVVKSIFELGRHKESLELTLRTSTKLKELPDNYENTESRLNFLIITMNTLITMVEIKKGLELVQEGDLLVNKLEENGSGDSDYYIACYEKTKGMLYTHNDNFAEALKYLRRSSDEFKRLGEKRDISVCKNNMGVVYAKQGRLNEANKYFKECLDLRKELGNIRDICASLCNLSHCYSLIGDLNRSLDYMEEYNHYSKKMHDDSLKVIYLTQKAMILQKKGELEQALQICKDKLIIDKKLGNNSHIALSYYNIGAILVPLGEYDEALKYFEESLIIRKKLGIERDIAHSLKGIAIVQTRKGEWDKSLAKLKESLVILEKINDPIPIAEVLFHIVSTSISSSEDDEKTRIYLEKLKRIESQVTNKDITLKTKVSEAQVMLNSDDLNTLNKGQKLLKSVIDDEDIFNYSNKLSAMIYYTRILLKKYILQGDEKLLGEIDTMLEEIIKNSERKKFRTTITEVSYLKGKIAMLKFDRKKAEKIFQEVKKQSNEIGYNGMLVSIDESLNKIKNLEAYETISEMNEEQIKNYKQETIDDIVEYMNKINLEFQFA